jgi:hypothetical protein
LNQLFILKPSPPDSVSAFVEFWAERYHYPGEQLYTRNIDGPHTPKGLRDLFKWKIGTRFFAAKLKRQSVEQNFISRLDEAQRLLRSLVSRELRGVAEGFLEHFNDGGAIWRIFWLHCWDTRFPIYDQHV